MKQKGFWFLAAITVITSLIFPNVALSQKSPAGEIRWRMQVSHPATALMFEYFKKFQSEIAKRSGTRLKIDLHPGYGLGYKEADSLLAVKDGLIETSNDYSSHWAGLIPIFGAGNLPFFYKSDEDRVKGLSALAPLYDRELRKFGCKLLMLEGLPMVYLFSRTPVVKFEDFKGKKIRVSAKPVMTALTKMGASPQTIALSEAITAMQTGVIDGQIWSIRAGLTYKIQDVVHYVSAWPFYGVESATIVNEAAFNKLSPDLQKIVENVSKEVERDLIKNVMLGEGRDIEEMKATGKMKFFQPDKDAIEKARNIAKSVWEEWAKSVGPVGRETIQVIEKTLAQ